MRSFSLNSQMMVIFKNPRDELYFFNIARQMFPQNSACFMSSFRQATEKNHRYIIVDNATKVNRKYQLRTNILPGEDAIVRSYKMKLSKTDRYLFTFLSTANTSQIKAIISTLNLCQQKTLIEICYYILQGVVPVTIGEKTKLSSHQKNIRTKIANSLSTRQRRTRLLK